MYLRTRYLRTMYGDQVPAHHEVREIKHLGTGSLEIVGVSNRYINYRQ